MKYRTLLLDWDSTVAACEGQDELARIAGKDPGRVKDLTARGMEGKVGFAEAFRERMDYMQPSREHLEALAVRYRETLVPGIHEFLQAVGPENVFIVSGGLRQSILPVAEGLGIAAERVRAIEVLFDPRGRYQGYDLASPFLQEKGKAIVVREIRGRRPGPALLVGDGATDCEAAGEVDFFLGFGGVVVREGVKAKASAYVTSPDARAWIPYCLGGAGP